MLPNFTLGININPIDSCNLQCQFCSYHQKRKVAGTSIDYDSFKKTLIGLDRSRIPVRHIIFSGDGEALMHKQFVDLAQEASKATVSFTGIVTNGVLLTEGMSKALISAGMSYFSISITGNTPDVYKDFQGGGNTHSSAAIKKQLETVIKNIDDLCRIREKSLKEDITINVSYILTEGNKPYILPYIKFFRDIGVDEVLIRPLRKKSAVDKKTIEGRTEKVIEREGCLCSIAGNPMQILSNGDVFACCVPSPELKLGNIFETSLVEILNSEKFMKILNNLYHANNTMPQYCRTCQSGFSYVGS